MTPIHLSPFANHLWQSTLFAGVAMLLTLVLRKNRAPMRYWVWFAASVKFLVPFSLLVRVGSLFEWRTAPAAVPALSAAIQQVSQPFALSAIPVGAAPATPGISSIVPALLVAVWFGGCALVLFRWWSRQRRIREALRNASPFPIHAPIAVWSSPTLLEPGVFGIFRPVLLLPEGIAERLTPAELQAILAHEFCHVRRRDNLTAAIHMVVEAMVWFHPLVWWIGARMIEERELACDEEVLRLGNQPQVYAESILNVCKFYVESPLACASGVTGADLKKRIEAIMTKRILAGMTLARKLLLIATGIAVVAGPIVIGMLNAPRTHAQTQAGGEAGLRFEVASIKPADPNSPGVRLQRTPGNGLNASGVTLKALIEFAYDVQDFQISGGPGWFRTDRWDVLAKPEGPEGPNDPREASEPQQKQLWGQLRQRLRPLLAERFQLSIHRESEERPVYFLVLAKNGHKLQAATEESGIARDFGFISSNGGTMEMFAHVLSNVLSRPVLDRTGVSGRLKFRMDFTEDSPRGAGKGVPVETPADTNPPDRTGPSIFTAIQEQLGLRLEAQKGPVDIIVIDRAERPSAN